MYVFLSEESFLKFPRDFWDFLDLYHYEKLMFNQRMTLKGAVNLKQWEGCRASAQLPSCSCTFSQPQSWQVSDRSGDPTGPEFPASKSCFLTWLQLLEMASPVAYSAASLLGFGIKFSWLGKLGELAGSVSLGVLRWQCWCSRGHAPTRVMRQMRVPLRKPADSEHRTHVTPLLSAACHPWVWGSEPCLFFSLKWRF